jgi:predicted nucleotidyltransferase component of viral defense system
LIPRAYIVEWGSRVPWPTEADIEQDLILSRLMVEIAANDLLRDELVMRGGTCLHKLHLPRPLRYSEDLDYVRCTRSGIGPYMDILREIATDIGLVERGLQRRDQMVHMTFDAGSTDGLRRIRIKIEMNIRETEACFDRLTRPYQVSSSWWSGAADIGTFHLEELMGTKLRALYQRSKGRDLFDLWQGLLETDANDGRIIQAFNHYMQDGAFTYSDLATNLADKLTDPDFADDLNELVTTPPAGYELAAAADLVIERLGCRLAKAPSADEIRGGRWRLGSRRS